MASSRLSPLQRLFGSHLYVLGSLVCTCVLLAGIGVNLLMRTGQWPPALVRSESAVVISGPGSGGTPIPV